MFAAAKNGNVHCGGFIEKVSIVVDLKCGKKLSKKPSKTFVDLKKGCIFAPA